MNFRPFPFFYVNLAAIAPHVAGVLRRPRPALLSASAAVEPLKLFSASRDSVLFHGFAAVGALCPGQTQANLGPAAFEVDFQRHERQAFGLQFSRILAISRLRSRAAGAARSGTAVVANWYGGI